LKIEELAQPSTLGSLRDYTFLIYQVGFPWALGSAGMVFIAVLIARLKPASSFLRGERLFWLLFVPVTFLLGIAVNPGADRFGIAHICLQPLVIIGLGFLAAGLPRIRLPWRWLIVPGLLLDFGLGIFLHFSLQGLDYYIVQNAAGRFELRADQLMSQASQANARYKLFPGQLIKDDDPSLRKELSADVGLTYFGDHFAGLLPVLQITLLAAAAGIGFAGLRAALRPHTAPPVVGNAAAPQPTRRKRPRR
jgi:hypothetical protein